MNNLVKWIWLRENHAGKLKWFVLTSLPPKTFSKPTPSWGTNSEKNMFSKGKKLSTSKTFVQLLQHAKLEEVLSTCFKIVTAAACLLRICGASSDLKSSVHRLLLAYALIFLLCSSTLASLSQHYGSSQLPFCKQTHACITRFSEEKYLLSHFTKSTLSEKKKWFRCIDPN